jgi:drug/metabolite transporter (DMT)-like permease
VLAALAATLLFSFSTICGHRSARMIGGTEANFWRLCIAVVLLGIYSFTFGIGLGGPSFPWFLVSGIIGIGIGDVALFQALPRLGPRLCSLLTNCLNPFAGILIEWLWLGTTLSPLQYGCIAVIIIGVMLALSPKDHPRLNRQSLTAGICFSVIAALGTALGAVISRKAYAIANELGPEIDGANAAFQRIFGGMFVAGISVLVVKARHLKNPGIMSLDSAIPVTRAKWAAVWHWVLLNSLAGQVFGISFMQQALEHTPTGIVLAIISLSPIGVIPLAMIFENERPTARSLAGAVLGVSGVIALTLAKHG